MINRNLIRLGLTILGVIGVPVTSYLSVKCHEKAKDAETKSDKLKAYLPAIISGTVTTGSIIGSHRMSSKEIAALTATATYAITNRNKLEEELGKYVDTKEAKQIKTEVAKLASGNEKSAGPSFETTGKGSLKVLEGYSGRWFYSSIEAVTEAEKKLNNRLKSGDYVCMNDFYSWLGIATTHFGDQWGWAPNEDYYDYTIDDPIEFENTLVDDENGEPLLIIDIFTYPMECWRDV